MPRFHSPAAVALTAAFCAGGSAAGAGSARVRWDPAHSKNLYRVRVLLDGDARGIWIGDSWCRMGRPDRLPYGALATWPFSSVSAVAIGYLPGDGIGRVENYTSGPGSLEEVDYHTDWVVETNGGEPAYFALPTDDVSKVFGDPGLVLPTSGYALDRIQSLGIKNAAFAATDSGIFSGPGRHVRCRVLYYAPADLDDMVDRVVLTDAGQIVRGVALLREESRPKWRSGQDPEMDPSVAPTPSQINAVAWDIPLELELVQGTRLVVRQDPSSPLVGSNDYWFLAGEVQYRVDAGGRREPGYYHTALTEDSWTFAGLADDHGSRGDKVYTDEQLGNWLDVTTLDRGQQPVVIVHCATEDQTYDAYLGWLQRIRGRYRTLFAEIGAPEPRFLLIGSYMHQIPGRSIAASRAAIRRLDSVYADLASGEEDCAFFSLYEATDGVFFTTDDIGGPGTQQAARDWLDANGWSTITYGGKLYHLSSAEDGGADGVFLTDGLHIWVGPGAAFYAKLIGDAIAASSCPADFDGDQTADSRDVLAFLSAWADGDPAADFNGDGTVDTRDVAAFLNVWSASC